MRTGLVPLPAPLTRRIVALPASLIAVAALAVPAQAAAGAGPSGTGFEPLPSLPVNTCQDSTLPRSYGTNFPVPHDPNGYGFANQSVTGWEGNFYAPISYLSGAYFARCVRLPPVPAAAAAFLFAFASSRLVPACLKLSFAMPLAFVLAPPIVAPATGWSFSVSTTVKLTCLPTRVRLGPLAWSSFLPNRS